MTDRQRDRPTPPRLSDPSHSHILSQGAGHPARSLLRGVCCDHRHRPDRRHRQRQVRRQPDAGGAWRARHRCRQGGSRGLPTRGSGCYDAVVAAFGADVVGAGRRDRPQGARGESLRRPAAQRKRLEGIVWPWMRETMDGRLAKHPRRGHAGRRAGSGGADRGGLDADHRPGVGRDRRARNRPQARDGAQRPHGRASRRAHRRATDERRAREARAGDHRQQRHAGRTEAARRGRMGEARRSRGPAQPPRHAPGGTR